MFYLNSNTNSVDQDQPSDYIACNAAGFNLLSVQLHCLVDYKSEIIVTGIPLLKTASRGTFHLL